jgi:PAS domain S-box-containing protein
MSDPVEPGATPATRPSASIALAAALQETERRLYALAEASPYAKCVHRRFRPLFANQAFAELMRFDGVEHVLRQASLAPLFDPAVQSDPERAWVEALAAPRSERRVVLLRHDGSSFPARMSMRTVLWDDEPALAVAVEDLTQHEEAARALAIAKREAETAARAKLQFLADAAHLLRTPLHASMGRLQVLGERRLPAPEAGLVQEALNGCQRLLLHLENISDLATGGGQADPKCAEPFDPAEAAAAAAAMVQDSHAGAKIVVQASNADAQRLLGERGRVTRVLVALLEEACTRTAEPIGLDVGLEGEGLSYLVHCVAGDRRAAAPAVPYDPRATARRLVQEMGGVMAERETGDHWSTTVFLPLPRAPAEPTGLGMRPCDILVVDDHPGNQRLIETILSSVGHRPHLASDGAEAVAAVTCRAFDLVLMDLAMPGVDGFEAARRIRQLTVPWSDVPIAALTASCTPGVREQVFEAGMDAFLQKPVDIPRLLATIARLAPPLGPRYDLVQPAELKQVQPEKREHETENDDQRRHRSVL